MDKRLRVEVDCDGGHHRGNPRTQRMEEGMKPEVWEKMV
jgi:hypothetical protein